MNLKSIYLTEINNLMLKNRNVKKNTSRSLARGRKESKNKTLAKMLGLFFTITPDNYGFTKLKLLNIWSFFCKLFNSFE